MANNDASQVVDELSTSVQKLSLINREYLFLPDNPFSDSQPFETNYLVYLPPTNSSGDIYHIITYLMLSKYEKKRLPLVQLSYDGQAKMTSHESKMNTFTQTKRCLQFAEKLSFQEQFPNPFDLSKGHYRQNARSKKMWNALINHHDQRSNTYYVEQKLLTTLISYYFLKHGRDNTVNILNQSYANWSVNENVDQNIKKAVKEQIREMKIESQSKPLIILQYCYSSKANSNQNINEINFFPRLEEYLKSQGYKTWYLFVDSRLQNSPKFNDIKNQTDCFPFSIDDVDYGKLYHLEFLLQLSKIKSVRGVIGNTSGCLDLAAFIGYDVLNLHQFHDKINYQAYRIFLQSSFLTIEDFNRNDLKNALQTKKNHSITFDEILNENMPITTAWIDRRRKIPTFPVTLLADVQEVKINNNGFGNLHQIKRWRKAKLEGRKVFIYYVLTCCIFLRFAICSWKSDPLPNE